MIRSVAALLDRLVDYAGLFPPAKLSMEQAAGNFARYRRSEHAFALGRFVVPASRLSELEAVSATAFDGWLLSALVATDADLEAIAAFNTRNAGRARVDSIEMKVEAIDAIERAASTIPTTLAVFFEIPPGGDLRTMLAEVRARHGHAKIRTGGITSDAFPTVSDIVRFIAACAKDGVSFKATAGLHHPLRCVRPLTYEPGSETGTMHGFVNLFLAAAVLRAGADEPTATRLMEDGAASSFTATDAGIAWRGTLVPVESIVEMRREFALSFGSCSFEEPIEELRAIGWL
ncbi:MAG: hypothetical protein WA208_18210 [Thermoanaerobaculia bacterium]